MMKTLVLIFAATMGLTACGGSGSSKSTPPANMVGVWLENATVQSVVGSTNPQQQQDPCQELSVQGQSVSTFLFKIDADGTVYDAKSISDSTQLYRVIGRMQSNGAIIPNDLGKEEFLGILANIQGVVVTPLVTTQYSVDALKGPKVTLTIDAQLVYQGQTVKQTLETRTYYSTTVAQEKAILSKASACVQKAKGNKP
ncbi:MAG: hypothetical protein H6623_02970 [Bdellovibrionaceae bacterium]|nr:hypothetical protein [Pseudobdellovibrionaceae bacterium]